MRIVVDVMGGDHGIEVVIDGVKQALDSQQAITALFVIGDEEQIRPALDRFQVRDSRLKVIHSSEVLSMEDKPLDVLRKKKGSSMGMAIEMVRNGEADAIISRGNTGGLVAASTVRLRPIEGVERPAIAIVVPSALGEFVLLDAGANAECKPIHLAQFAVMGSVYSREILGRANPRVGLLSNGTEESKGNDLTRETLKLCRQLDLNFLGYVEGHDLFEDHVDVVVTDGFIGNIVLKTIESMGKSIKTMLEAELRKNPLRMAGAALAYGGLRQIKRRMNPDNYGGAPLLGLNGTVIKAHGSARALAIKNAIRVACETLQNKISQVIQIQIAKANQAAAAFEGSIHPA